MPVWNDADENWASCPTGAIVSATEYNDAGEVSETIDNAGNVEQYSYDDAGNVVQTVQNFQDSANAPDGPRPEYEADVVTTNSTYDGSLLSAVTVQSGGKTETTQYVYGTATNGATRLLYDNDLVSAVIYPGSTDPAVTYSNGSATIAGTDHVCTRMTFRAKWPR